MRRIKYVALEGQTQVFCPVPQIARSFKDGEEMLADDEQATILFGNPNFVDAETGKNPNYTCTSCGAFTRTLMVFAPAKCSHLPEPSYPLVDKDGNRICLDCSEIKPEQEEPTMIQPMDFKPATVGGAK